MHARSGQSAGAQAARQAAASAAGQRQAHAGLRSALRGAAGRVLRGGCGHCCRHALTAGTHSQQVCTYVCGSQCGCDDLGVHSVVAVATVAGIQLRKEADALLLAGLRPGGQADHTWPRLGGQTDGTGRQVGGKRDQKGKLAV
eukprot:1158228-Pelagomonas_calceolata.AAC.4